MKACIVEFDRRIATIRQFLDGQSLELEVLAHHLVLPAQANQQALTDLVQRYQAHFGAFRADKTELDYKTAIVALYGALENFIESLVVAYLNYLNKTVPQYSALPERIQETHDSASATLILNTELLAKYETVAVDEVVANLHSCHLGRRFKLNAIAYTYHKANFRAGTINEFLAAVGIQGVSTAVRQDEQFRNDFKQSYPDVSLDNAPESVVFANIDDLAERRNEVAHGVEGNILGAKMLKFHVDDVERYAKALWRVVFAESLKMEVRYRAITLPPAIAVHNHSIVCVELHNSDVAVADTLISRSPEDCLSAGEILELQYNRRPFKRLPPRPSIQVALRVGFRVKQTHRFYLVNRRESLPFVIQGDGWIAGV